MFFYLFILLAVGLSLSRKKNSIKSHMLLWTAWGCSNRKFRFGHKVIHYTILVPGTQFVILRSSTLLLSNLISKLPIVSHLYLSKLRLLKHLHGGSINLLKNCDIFNFFFLFQESLLCSYFLSSAICVSKFNPNSPAFAVFPRLHLLMMLMMFHDDDEADF